MSNYWKHTLSLIIFVVFFSVALPIFAQTSSNKIIIKTTPSIPGAFENVTINLSSVAINLSKANISWNIDGKIVDSGFGKDTLTIKTGPVGTSTIISVSIILNTMERIDKTIVINPSEIDILWQAIDSYVPPFYKGKALPASESDIKIVAIPNIKVAGNKLKPTDLVYVWKRNYEVNTDNSGYGKNSFVFTQSYFNEEENISVEASSINQNFAARKSITIKTYPPRIIFYETRPLFGNIYEKAINEGLYISNSETGIIAEPYFFSPKDINDKKLGFSWNINGKNISEPSQKNKILVAPVDSSNKESIIKLTVENFGKLFQSRTQNLKVTSY